MLRVNWLDPPLPPLSSRGFGTTADMKATARQERKRGFYAGVGLLGKYKLP
jgi:hypothetical protein